MLTAAADDVEGLVMEVAVMVAENPVPTVAGAVYVVAVVVVLESAPHPVLGHPVPLSDQLTPAEPDTFDTLAV